MSQRYTSIDIIVQLLLSSLEACQKTIRVTSSLASNDPDEKHHNETLQHSCTRLVFLWSEAFRVEHGLNPGRDAFDELLNLSAWQKLGDAVEPLQEVFFPFLSLWCFSENPVDDLIWANQKG